MISDKFALEQIGRLAGLDQYPRGEKGALNELRLAIQVADTEAIASSTVDYIMGHSTSTNPRCPLPADIRGLANDANERASARRQTGCEACQFTGWRQIVRGGYSGVERCVCQCQA
jgi:hypothetical protein